MFDFSLANILQPGGYVGYNPLINYKWSTLPISDEYVTDVKELVINGDFSEGLDSWLLDSVGGSPSNIDGKCAIVNDGSGFTGIKQKVFEASGFFEISFDYTKVSGDIRFQTNSEVHILSLSSGHHTYIVNTLYTTGLLYFGGSKEGEGYIDNISVKKVIIEPNTRYLKDNGTSPKYHAKSYFGRGMKFNGVDQSLDGGTWGDKGFVGVVNEFTILINSVTDISNVLLNTGYASMNNGLSINSVGGLIALSAYSTKNSSLVSSKTKGVIAVTFKNFHYKLYVDGKLEAEKIFDYEGNGFIFSTSEHLSIGAYRLTSGYNSGITNNLIVVNQALTPEQIKYQYNYPETFLYYDEVTVNGVTSYVKRSKILNQSELDNVVAHLPMCDTDEYTRDMVGYSKELLPITFSDITNDTEEGTFSATDSSIDCDVTAAGGNSARPRFTYNIPSTLGTDELWIEFDLSLVSGEFVMSQIYILGTDEVTRFNISTPGHYSIKLNSTDAGNSKLGFYIYGTKVGHIQLFNIKLLRTTSAYETTNYTTSVRDEAKLLPYGLQTSSWKRDVFGVPTALSQYLECDGVGYVDTRYKPKPVSNFQFEVILDNTLLSTNKDAVVVGTGTYNKIRIMLFKNIIYFQIDQVDGGGIAKAIQPTTIYHCVLEYINDGSFNAYLNGDLIGSAAGLTFNEDTENFYIGKTAGAYKPKGSVKLFKVHTRPQDPAKLYEDAFKKGLLAPDNALRDANGNVVVDADGNYIITEDD